MKILGYCIEDKEVDQKSWETNFINLNENKLINYQISTTKEKHGNNWNWGLSVLVMPRIKLSDTFKCRGNVMRYKYRNFDHVTGLSKHQHEGTTKSELHSKTKIISIYVYTNILNFAGGCRGKTAPKPVSGSPVSLRREKKERQLSDWKKN